MEEMTPAVAMTLSLAANTMCESSPVEITQLKNVTDAADLLSDSENQSFCNGGTECTMEDVSELEEVGEQDLLKTLSDTRSGSSNVFDEDDVLSVVEDNSAVISEGLLVVDAGSELSLSNTAMEIDNGRVLATAIIVGESSIEQVPTAEVLIAGVNQDTNTSEVVIRLPDENSNHLVKGRSVYELDCIPLWGTVSIQGNRSEMEDAFAVSPHFLKLPIKMLMGDHEGMSPSLTHLTGHFFGVYDGHGGHKVCYIHILCKLF